MRKIDKETRARFEDTFNRINQGLNEKFPRLFGGGHAYLELVGDDPRQGLVKFLGAVGAEHKHRVALKPLRGQPLEEGEGEVVGPLQVVEHEQQGLGATERREGVGERVEQPPPRRRGRDVGRVGVLVNPRNHRQRGLIRREDLRPRPEKLRRGLLALGAAPVGDGHEERAKRVQYGAARHAPLQARGAHDEGGVGVTLEGRHRVVQRGVGARHGHALSGQGEHPPRGRVTGHLRRDAGLADAALAAEQHAPADAAVATDNCKAVSFTLGRSTVAAE